MNRGIKKVDKLNDKILEQYDLTKKQVLEKLKEHGITESEQMVLVWCREGEIDAVRIAKGPVSERGIRVSSDSLRAFINLRNGNVEALRNELELERERRRIFQSLFKKAEEKIRKYEEDGYILVEEMMKEIKISDVELVGEETGRTQLQFKYERSQHLAIFDDDNSLIKLQKRTRTGWIEVEEISSSLCKTLEKLYEQHSKQK